jgi:acrylyl-CoA reductase (NADPH)
MPPTSFRALLSEGMRKNYRTDFKQMTDDALPPGEVLIDVVYSSLNFKDGLAVTGRGDIIKRFPMVCGIDLAGRVVESTSPEFRAGDEVLGVGQAMGESVWGGYSQRARVPASAILRLPAGLDLKRSMAIGTAGFTAMLCLMALEHQGLQPGEREVLVTGSGGGVGSVAVALLAARGYKVAASTGRTELHDYLRNLGAGTIVDRTTLTGTTPLLLSERWAGAIDTVLAATSANGAVAACGLVGGVELPTSVIPFILRNVALLGINSVQAPKPTRIRAWDRVSKELPLDKLDLMTTVEPLSSIQDLCERILAGRIRGRVVIDVNQ